MAVSRLIAASGILYLAASVILAASRPLLGSTHFLMLAAVMAAAYVLVLARVWHRPEGSRRTLLAAFLLAIAFRLPIALAPVDADNDMVRYVWDGRIQLLGHNPYLVRPADPELASTHTAETAAMPSRRARTPYPPAAQLFFRMVVAVKDSTRAMKLALVACDLLTMIVVWRWLIVANRNEWLALAYAWHPLVVLEVSYSGHIDALGALWIAASVYWLARRRTALASIAFALAVATKLLPVVLAPLFVGRVRWRDMLLAAAFFSVLYVRYADGTEIPLGAVPNVVQHIRFNGPVFRAIAALLSPQAAAGAAVALGTAIAVWARLRLSPTDPSAWAWPMGAALLCAPVIYPWYLLCLTPFLFTSATLPLSAWTFSVIPVYVVWQLAREGARWKVPVPLTVLEFGVFLAAIAALLVWAWRGANERRRSAA